MAVLFILALVTTLMVIAIPSGPGGPEAAARNFSVAANLASREAISEGRTHTISLSREGWTVRAWSVGGTGDGEWVDRAGADWQTRVEVDVEQVPVELPEEPEPLILFDPTGGATAYVIALGSGRERWSVVGDTQGRASLESGRVR